MDDARTLQDAERKAAKAATPRKASRNSRIDASARSFSTGRRGPRVLLYVAPRLPNVAIADAILQFATGQQDGIAASYDEQLKSDFAKSNDAFRRFLRAEKQEKLQDWADTVESIRAAISDTQVKLATKAN